MLLCQQNHKTLKTHSSYHSWTITLHSTRSIVYSGHDLERVYMYTILPSVTLMLHVYQVCHGVDVGCCVKNMSFFLEPGVKISREYCLDILNKCSLLFNTSQPTIIFQHDKTPARCVRNIVQLPQREILNLFFSWTAAPNSPELNPINLASLITVWIWFASHQDWRNQAATGWSLTSK